MLVQGSHIIQQLAYDMPGLCRLRGRRHFGFAPLTDDAVKGMPGGIELPAERRQVVRRLKQGIKGWVTQQFRDRKGSVRHGI